MQPDLTSLSEEHRDAVLRVLEAARQTKRARFLFLEDDTDVFACPSGDGLWRIGVNGKFGHIWRGLVQ
jgi:hypothetical protein